MENNSQQFSNQEKNAHRHDNPFIQPELLEINGYNLMQKLSKHMYESWMAWSISMKRMIKRVMRMIGNNGK